MKRAIWAIFLVLVGCVSALTYVEAYTGQTGSSGSNQELISVEPFATMSVPVRIKKAKATKFNEKTVLSYSVTNETGENLRALHFVVFMVDSNNQIRGGEGWTLNTDLANQSSIELPVSLQNKVAKDDRLLLTVWKAEGATQTLSLDPSDVVKAAKDFAVTRQARAEAKMGHARRVAASPSPADACADGQKFATESCKCGIKTFSCNPSTGQYSFECFEPTLCPTSPQTKPQ